MPMTGVINPINMLQSSINQAYISVPQQKYTFLNESAPYFLPESITVTKTGLTQNISPHTVRF